MRALLLLSLLTVACNQGDKPIRLGNGSAVDDGAPAGGWGDKEPGSSNGGGNGGTDTGIDSDSGSAGNGGNGGNGGANGGGNPGGGGTGFPGLGTGLLDTDSDGVPDYGTGLLGILRGLYDTDSDGVIDSGAGGTGFPATAGPMVPPSVILANTPILGLHLFGSAATFP
ncbi:MAG: hypothetical protein H6732_20420 [Alphaproteobacteria bacterium]|nr:hypothetical protein [Alphaproteobacteria bacterium]